MAHADALAAGVLDLDTLLEQYNEIAYSQVEELLTLANRISQTLSDVTPAREFVDDLRRQLSEGIIPGNRSWWERIRQLPPSAQLAAGIGGATLTAGVVLIASRPVLDALADWRSRRTAAA
ncbi:MAG: hypothetical protein JXJ20_01085 [Anaerolineae bacterium]|nr:hypothetical protein [Anaerolineae bacterium]